MAALGEFDGQRKRCARQGSANTGPPASRGRRGSALTRSATASGWFEVVIEQIEMDGILRPGVVAPQFAGRETNRIDVLRLLAEEMGVRIREQEDAVIALDGPRSCTHIAWQARVADRMHVACPH
jgi:hypothetical protein